MAVSSSPAVAAEPVPDVLSEKQARILKHLRQHVDGRTYFKSRCIAEDVGLSAKEVGTNMPALCQESVGLEIEKWGYTSSTTWMVSPDP